VDGEQYNKLEMCSILEALDTGIYSKQRGKAIAEMIRLKYVPCKKSAIYNLLKKRRDGKPIMNRDWISASRPPLLDSKSMDANVEKIKEHQGRAVGADDLSKMIVLQRKEMVAEAGFSPVGVPDELKTTTRLAYTAEFALRQDVSIVNKTIRKTNNRFTAENSVIAAFNLALLIAATVYHEVAAEDPQVAKEMQEADHETRVLYDLVAKARGLCD
jgi:hypothetical protein